MKVSAEKRILKSFNTREAPFPAVCEDVASDELHFLKLAVRNC